MVRLRLLFLGFVLTFLAACAGARESARDLRIQKIEDEALRGAQASRDDAGAWSAPSRTETEAVYRMESAIAAAERLRHDEELSGEERDALIQALQGARAALERYRAVRLEEAARATTLGTIGVVAAAIVADDATVVGVADDPLLIPLALAAMVAVLQSNAPSTRDELARAWLDLGHQLEVLRETLAMTSRGNVIHKHLVDEARTRAIRRAAAEGVILTESQVSEEMLCDELQRMAQELRYLNKIEWKKAISTQKGLQCRASRNGRE